MQDKKEMEMCIKLLEKGLGQQEIADIVGCSRQRVGYLANRAKVAKKRRDNSPKETALDGVQYEGLREYLKENHKFIGEFASEFEDVYDYTTIRNFLCTAKNKQIGIAISIIQKTGLTFEELFMKEFEN